MKLLRCIFVLLLVSVVGCATGQQMVELDSTFGKKPEFERLRFFKEINIDSARSEYNLTGKGVRVTLMGDIVDPDHPDLIKRINKQYNTTVIKGKAVSGNSNRPYGYEFMGPGDGHGTHIAGTVAAECDGIGIQGVACGATIDTYDLNFGGNEDIPIDGWGDAHEISVGIGSFAYALRHIVQTGQSRIVTGSFNVESPIIRYKQNSDLPQLKTLLKPADDGQINSADDLFRLIAEPADKFELQYATEIFEEYEDGAEVVGPSVIPLSEAWDNLTTAVAAYQRADGVYLITESNIDFYGRTSVVNAMPTLSNRVDDGLWLSVVMVQPANLDELLAEAAENEMTADELNERIMNGYYTTPLNSCGMSARQYCIVVPSYLVLSTITARVNEEDEAMYTVDGRSYQIMTGHSMGAPMVAAALALMEEYNLRENMGYTMKDLVHILKKNANRSFKGYDLAKHGQGMLDVDAAIKGMIKDM